MSNDLRQKEVKFFGRSGDLTKEKKKGACSCRVAVGQMSAMCLCHTVFMQMFQSKGKNKNRQTNPQNSNHLFDHIRGKKHTT